MSKAKSNNSSPSLEGLFLSRRQALRAASQDHGKETPDPTPVAVPVGHDRPLTLREEMRRFIRNELSQQAQEEGHESFEEFDDFSIPDEEPDLTSPYTVQMQDEPGSYLLEPDTGEAVTGGEQAQASPSDEHQHDPENKGLEAEAEGEGGSPKGETPEGLTNNASER